MISYYTFIQQQRIIYSLESTFTVCVPAMENVKEN